MGEKSLYYYSVHQALPVVSDGDLLFASSHTRYSIFFCAMTRVLLLGGHGKVSLLMTPRMLRESWHVITVVRNPDHREEILKLGKDHPGRLEVLVEDIEQHRTAKDAKKILDQTKPDYVVWSAGRYRQPRVKV